MKYKVIGKISDDKVKSMFKVNSLEDVFSSLSEKTHYKRISKSIIIGAFTIVSMTMFGDTSFALGEELNTDKYKKPDDLDAIFAFIDWLILLTRIIVSSVIGLIATYAGHKWATDLSASGVSEAKKILKNCAWGLFVVHFGATIANFFINKLQSLLNYYG